MNSHTFTPISPRPAPVRLLFWLRANLFNGWKTSLATVFVGGFLLWYLPQFLDWAIFSARWAPVAEACRAEGAGACWGVIAEKYRLILFGRYPFEEQWRPLVASMFMPVGFSIDVLIRVLVGITLFAAAYMAEVIRGGLQAIPKGQLEAAATLGLSYWQTQRKIVLPQALAMVVPGIMNNFIAIFMDTSLVTIVSLYELTGALGLALNSDADWRPFKIEGYFFIALIYFGFCFSMSLYSRWIEKQANRGKQR